MKSKFHYWRLIAGKNELRFTWTENLNEWNMNKVANYQKAITIIIFAIKSRIYLYRMKWETLKANFFHWENPGVVLNFGINFRRNNLIKAYTETWQKKRMKKGKRKPVNNEIRRGQTWFNATGQDKPLIENDVVER